jgi:TolB-like protein
VRRFVPLLFLAASLALVAATPSPKPSAAPNSTPSASSATPKPAFAAVPTVLIYPFETQSGADPKIGAAISQILSQTMTGAGGMNVHTAPPNVARSDFQNYARQQHADFYISGYVTPIGDTASVVEQVVSVESGVILFSQTAQVFNVSDVASQSLQARAEILAYTNRGTQNIQRTSSNTPAPAVTNGAQVKLGGISGIVDSVFHHHNAATPTPMPASAKPSRGIIVAPVAGSGNVPAADLTSATNELYFALSRRYNASITTVKGNVATSADTICGTQRNNTIAGGTIAENIPKRGREVEFTLAVYTCFGAVLDTKTGKGNSLKAAIDAAASAYAAAHPQNS